MAFRWRSIGQTWVRRKKKFGKKNVWKFFYQLIWSAAADHAWSTDQPISWSDQLIRSFKNVFLFKIFFRKKIKKIYQQISWLDHSKNVFLFKNFFEKKIEIFFISWSALPADQHSWSDHSKMFFFSRFF